MSSVIENKLPIDWSIKQLGQVGHIVTGNTPSKKNSDYWSEKSGYMFVKPPNLGTGNIVLSTNEMLTKEGFKKAKPIPKNSIMVCCIGSLGKIGIAGKELATNQQINSISFYKEIVEFKFGYYFALTLKSHMHKIANKAIVQIINKTSFSKIEIPLPPLEEQKRIVAKIDTLFSKIDKAISLTEESLKQAKNLLPSVLKEVFEKGKSDGWEEKKLKDICTIINGRAYKKTELLSQGKYRVLRVGNLFTNNSWYWSDLELKEDKYISNGDLIYAWSASFGPRVWNGEKVIYHYHIWKIVNRAEVSKDFLYNWLDWKTDTIKKENTSGATMIHVTKGMMESLIIQYPNINTQEQIVKSIEKLKKTFIEIQSKLEEQLAYLKQLKSSILSKAFKGEL